MHYAKIKEILLTKMSGVQQLSVRQKIYYVNCLSLFFSLQCVQITKSVSFIFQLLKNFLSCHSYRFYVVCSICCTSYQYASLSFFFFLRGHLVVLHIETGKFNYLLTQAYTDFNKCYTPDSWLLSKVFLCFLCNATLI